MEVRPGYTLVELGVIPVDWETPLLDAVAKRGSGHTPDKKHPEYWNGDIQWVSLKDSDALDQIYIDETAASITPAGIANSSATVHPAGTVVLSRDAGVGKSAIMKRDMAVSQHFMAWQCGPRLDNFFLYYWLQAKKPEFERIAMGNTIKTIGLSYFRALRIPNPSVREQRAIATTLSDVDALLAKLDALIAKKRDLKQATMQQLLTGQTRLPGFSGEWEVKRLGQCLLEIGDGATPSTANMANFGGGIAWAVIDDIGDEIWSTKSTLSEKGLLSCTAKLWPPGTVILSTGATIGEVGIARVPLATKQGICGLRFDLNIAYPIFMKYWFVNSRQLLLSKAQGSSIKEVRAPTLVDLPITLPTEKEQSAIALVLSDMDAELTALEARRDKTRALKQGMMQELLTGRIRLV